jgi:Protein of unknown function (DUF3309)
MLEPDHPGNSRQTGHFAVPAGHVARTGAGIRRKSSGQRSIVPSALDGQLLNMLTLLIIVLVILAVSAAPAWPYSRGWGYYPSGGLGIIVLILLILAFTGRMNL